jgi:hypothetical protein
MNHDEKVAALIEHGGGIVGGIVGGVIGFLAGGPVGAAIGGAIGPAVQAAASDVAERVLSQREAMRVAVTMSYAIDFIRERLNRGDIPREDNFFVPDDTKRSPAEEILEGALLKMKNEHEERKARFYGQLFANVSFDPNCSLTEANHLLHVMDNLTFSQLSLLSLLANADKFPNLPTTDYSDKNVTGQLSTVLAATFELCQNGLITLDEPGDDDGGTVVLDPAEIQPAHMRLRPVGQRLHELAGLAAIGDSDELQKLAELMSADTGGVATVSVKRSFLRGR